jgi:hypothetical protein
MKMFMVLGLLLSGSVFALQVTGVQYNHKLDQLDIEVQYTGGCFEHRFAMRLLNCSISKTESIGVVNVCDAHIIDITEQEDLCQSEIKRRLTVSLVGLSDDARPVVIGFESGIVLIPKKG